MARVPYTNLPGKIGIEFFRIQEQSGRIRFYKEHHNSKLPPPGKPKILRGKGVLRGPLMSAFFYLDERSAYASGTMTLRQMNTNLGSPVLQGVYTQFIDRLGERIEFLTEPYNLVRVSLPLGVQLRRIAGLPYFSDFSAAQDFYNRLPDQLISYVEQGMQQSGDASTSTQTTGSGP